MTIGEQLRYEGMQQGKRLEAMSIARNMRTKGLDPDLIKEITGLAEQDIVEFSE